MNSNLRKNSSKLAIALGVLVAISSSSATVAHAQESGVSGRIWAGAVGRYVLSDNTPFSSAGFGTVSLKTNGTTVGFGGDIEFPYRKYTGAPMMKRNPVQSEDDAWNLRVPDDITTVGTIPVALEFSRLQYEAGMPVTVQVGSPLTWAGSICGEERLMVWMIRKPDLVHHVLRVITDFVIKKADYWINAFGAERLMAFDLCIETNKLYSPKQFETFAFPYLREIHDHLTRQGTSIFLSHICGEQNKNLPFWSQLSFGKRGMVSVGKEVALSTAGKVFPDCVIIGNVDPITVQEGTPEQVRALCKACIDEGKD
ncbi:MAG: uroporphyrinogen decarboxylase family protein, partial [Gaiellaceae bacterium]